MAAPVSVCWVRRVVREAATVSRGGRRASACSPREEDLPRHGTRRTRRGRMIACAPSLAKGTLTMKR